MPLALQIIARFIVLVPIQILVLDNIQFMGYINPMIYPLFVLTLPIRFPRWISLLLGFAVGLTIDVFSNSLGIHTFATVFLAFIRNPIISLYVAFDDNANPSPTFRVFGAGNYVKYIVTTVFLHHLVLFAAESFSLVSFGFVLPKIILSSVVSITLILLIQSFNSK